MKIGSTARLSGKRVGIEPYSEDVEEEEEEDDSSREFAVFSFPVYSSVCLI